MMGVAAISKKILAESVRPIEIPHPTACCRSPLRVSEVEVLVSYSVRTALMKRALGSANSAWAGSLSERSAAGCGRSAGVFRAAVVDDGAG